MRRTIKISGLLYPFRFLLAFFMPDIAPVLSVLIVLLIAFYVCVHTALTISEVKSAEASANVVPAAFRPRVTLAEHRKAIDYTGEIIQSDLVAALIGAGIALLLTFGNGFTLLLASITALCGQGLAAHIALALLISFALAVIDFPLCWWKEFRINERYGFEKTPARQWLIKSLKELILGWCSLAPVIVAVLVVCESASYHWWSFAFITTAAWFIWKVSLAPKIIGFRQSKPMNESALKERLRHLLGRLEYENAEICTMPRPKSWHHGNAMLVKQHGKVRLVIFNHVLARLTDDEVCAVAACAIGRINRCHNAARLMFFIGLSLFFWWGLAYLAEKTWFYASLNIEPSLAIPNGAINPGLLFCICITVVPVVLYPVVFLIHAFTRMLDYDEDAYAVSMVGAKPLVRALSKLHRDYRNSLVPNTLYSLANHRRPHVTQRIRAALLVEQRQRHNQASAVNDEQRTQATRFNMAMERRRRFRDEKLDARLRRKSEILREASALRHRNFSMQHS